MNYKLQMKRTINLSLLPYLKSTPDKIQEEKGYNMHQSLDQSEEGPFNK
jgi:hypothetical protein